MKPKINYQKVLEQLNRIEQQRREDEIKMREKILSDGETPQEDEKNQEPYKSPEYFSEWQIT